MGKIKPGKAPTTNAAGEKIRTITIRITDDEFKRFKSYTVMHDTDMTALLRDHIRKLLAAEERKQGKQNAE